MYIQTHSCICKCEYMCTCICTGMYMCMCICVCICICMLYVCVSESLLVSAYVHVQAFTYIYIYVRIEYTHMSMCICICTSVCMYPHIPIRRHPKPTRALYSEPIERTNGHPECLLSIGLFDGGGGGSPTIRFSWTPQVCKITAFCAIFRGLVLAILLGSRSVGSGDIEAPNQDISPTSCALRGGIPKSTMGPGLRVEAGGGRTLCSRSLRPFQ